MATYTPPITYLNPICMPNKDKYCSIDLKNHPKLKSLGFRCFLPYSLSLPLITVAFFFEKNFNSIVMLLLPRIRKIIFGILTIAGMFILCSCGKESEALLLEKDDRQFQKGQSFYKEGRYQESITLFLNVIEKRRDAPESHLEVGRLYLDHFKDPIAAIYHFRRFLEIKPNVEQSPMVRQMIERAKKNFARTLPGRPFDDDIGHLDLMDLLKRSQEENFLLKKQLASLQKGGAVSSAMSTKPAEPRPSFSPVTSSKPPASKAKLYTVVSGDTLGKISNKSYGSAAYWELIYKSNSDNLKTPHDLKVGQILKIPPKTN